MELPDLNTLRIEFSRKKQEVSTLRTQLSSLNIEKENIFRELRSLRDKIRSRSQKIRGLKENRDQLTKQVQELKVERNKLNEVVKSKVDGKKEVDQKKKNLLETLKIKDDPVSIKLMIERLETKLETEIMPFPKEKELNQKIKGFKSQLKELESLGKVWKEISSTSQDFHIIKKKAEQSHRNVQETAHQSQSMHEALNQLYAELKELRKSEQPLADKYIQFKAEYEKTGQNLEQVMARIKELGKILQVEDERSFKDKVEEKMAEVTEKIKKGKKLTTKDILAFQASRE